MVSFEDFKKIEIKIGTIIKVEKIAGSDKLLKLRIDLGKEKRQVVAGLAAFYEPDYLVGRQVPLIVNLESKVFLGQESQGMILAADNNGQPILIFPEKEVPAGSVIR